jgi:hypothetical protein
MVLTLLLVRLLLLLNDILGPDARKLRFLCFHLGNANGSGKANRHPQRGCLTRYLERKTGFEPATLTLAR